MERETWISLTSARLPAMEQGDAEEFCQGKQEQRALLV